jgi:hypothetical protein
MRLPTLTNAEEIIHASRLYRTALELIESRPDIAYQLLISTVETLANVALAGYEPEDSNKIETKRQVRKQALSYGLSEEQANHLALLACQGMSWSKRKFKKFLIDHVSETALAEKNRVFLVLPNLCPPPKSLETTLARIYEARSGNLHGGSSLPRSVRIGISPLIHFRSLPLNPLMPDEVPPVAWFERVVSLATRKFLLDRTGLKSPPFLDYGDSPTDPLPAPE